MKRYSIPHEARSMFMSGGQGAYREIHKRIKKTRARAQWVGFFYLIGTILLSALAFMPTVKIPYLNVIPGIREGSTLLWQDLKLGLNIDTISRAIYLVMLLTAVANIFRVCSHLSWLYKKRASKTYGFNRNVYAMQNMGKVFSGAFAGRLIGNTLLLLINGAYLGEAGKFDFTALNAALVSIKELSFGIDVDIPVAVVFVAIGVFFRLFCGFLGAKASYFVDKAEGGVTERKREVRRFPALFRNFLQLIVVLAIPVFLLQLSGVNVFFKNALEGKFSVDIPAFIQIGIFLFWVVLTVHATNLTEYNIDGAEGKGMKNFKWFIFLTFVASAALYYFNDSAFSFNLENVTIFNTIMLVGISFIMFLVEMIMRNAPSYAYNEFVDEEIDDEALEDDEYDVAW